MTTPKEIPISQRFEIAALKLSMASGYAFADHLVLTEEEESARYALVRLCCEVAAKAILADDISMRSFQELVERARDW